VNETRLGVDPGHLGEQHLDRRPPAKEAPQRGRNLAGREDTGRDLVEERLEEMVVRAVDEGDVDRLPTERPRRSQPTEAAADDDYAVPARLCRRSR
jgi:hypothetical protein